MGNVCSISFSMDDTISRCCNCTAGQVMHISKIEQNLDALRIGLDELKLMQNDVERRVILAEQQQLKRLDQVQGWLSSVEVMVAEAEELIRDGSQEIDKLCIGGCCSKNCIVSYEFGTQLAKKLEDIATLKGKGSFEVVADRVPSAVVDGRPVEKIVGTESIFSEVWGCITEKHVGIIGLYGMGGIGKTTLLTQINNNFLYTPTGFDLVIWVVVSKDLNLEKVQDDIGKKIGFSEDRWNNKSLEEKAIDIFRELSKKKFVLFLDDIWERVDLTKVGVPLPDTQNGSKLIFTTRSEEVCGLMDASRKIKVECLASDKAWELFQEKVGEDTLNIHPDIHNLAMTVVTECGGLPLALISIGRAMACKKTPGEWNYAVQILKKSASEFSVDDTILRCWDCTAGQVMYISKIEENLDALRIGLDELKQMQNDVKIRVILAEQQQLKRLDEVQGWFSRVEVMVAETEELIRDGSQEITKLCVEGGCSKNCKSSYKFGTQVTQLAKKLEDTDTLKREGNFVVVANRVPSSAVVDVRPVEKTVGMESIFSEVWGCITEKHVGIIGLYGMGGIGKTTLLTKINNNFHYTPKDFDLVIWVVVSKDLNLEKVQYDIGKKIGFSEDRWNNNRLEEKAIDIFKELSKKKFVLFLDDIWERVDLTKVGVPLPDTQNGSKLLFTTRSESVCGHMEASRKIKVECLASDKAWELFQEKVGEDTLNIHPDIRKLAKTIVQEFGGLPLALITIGRAMACKKTAREWNYAVQIFKKSASEFSGMGDGVFPRLKFSYDNLSSEKVKSCFLYCALFPHTTISKVDLIDYWIGEGMLDEYADISEAQNQGYDVIGTLLHACLLEHSGDDHVKMHDMIHDMALWIACECGMAKDNFLVQTNAQLIEVPSVGKWRRVKRMSLMKNHIGILKEEPECPDLLTLLLSNNRLCRIASGFFEFMPNLRVLNLSRNKDLIEVPSGISKLVSLQYLNLSHTGIRQLPTELIELVMLKYLNLEHLKELETIPRQVLSSFSMLQVLNMFYCGHSARLVKDRVYFGGNETLIEELQCLKHLIALRVTIKCASALKRFFSSHQLKSCTQGLFLHFLRGLSFLDMSSFVNMEHLNVLRMFYCRSLEDLKIDGVLEGKETRAPINLQNPTIINQKCFHSLRDVHIKVCLKLKDLTWLLFAPNLTTLHVFGCSAMEELINVRKLGKAQDVVRNLNPFAKLECLTLRNLPELKSIYWSDLPFLYLQSVSVITCPKLKKLPLNSLCATATGRKIVIKGETYWWNGLEWENEDTRNIFTSCFKPWY